MRRYTFFLFFIMIVFSCTDNDDIVKAVCGVDNPTEDLPWLKSIIDETNSNYSGFVKYFYISQATFQDKTVFISDNCCPYCNSVVPIYNCEGKLIGYVGNEIQREELTKSKVIYEHENNVCTTD